jgi:hypothetical protein
MISGRTLRTGGRVVYGAVLEPRRCTRTRKFESCPVLVGPSVGKYHVSVRRE